MDKLKIEDFTSYGLLYLRKNELISILSKYLIVEMEAEMSDKSVINIVINALFSRVQFLKGLNT